MINDILQNFIIFPAEFVLLVELVYVIKTLLERAFKICSGYNALHEELMKLKDYFKRNGYPIGLIENMIKKFMDRLYERNTTVATVNKMVKYIKLPYYGTSSFKIRKELKSLLEHSFGYIKFKITFTNPNRMKLFFLYKDRIPDRVRSNVIYKYKCSSCNTGYIGSTERMYFSRIQKHLGKSIRTFRPLTNPSHSVIRDHAWNLDHPLNANDFSILDSCRDLSSLRILESIYIKIHSPQLNNGVAPISLHTM